MGRFKIQKGLNTLQQHNCISILKNLKLAVQSLNKKYSSTNNNEARSIRVFKQNNFGILFISELGNDSHGINFIFISLGNLFEISHIYQEDNSKESFDITFDEDTKEIYPKSFYECDFLKSVIIKGNVKVIGNSAFSNCKNLKSVYILNGVEKIDDGAFRYCEKLTYITFPENIKFIGKNHFSNCKNLESIKISRCLKNRRLPSFNQDLFKGNINLKTITYPAYLDFKIKRILKKCFFVIIKKAKDKNNKTITCQVRYQSK